MKRTLTSIGLALTLLAATACRGGGSNTQTPATPDNGNVKLGVYADTSGPNAAEGQATKNGVELAADEINNAGGVGGRKLEVVFEDDHGTADGEASAVARLADARARAVIGGASPGALAAATKAQQAGVPLLTTSKDPKVTGAGDYVFRVSLLDAFQGEAMAKWAANNLHAKTVAILSESNSDYSDALARSFEENFVKLGGQVTQKQTYAPADADFKAQLTAIRDSNPEALFIPVGYAQAGKIAKQAKELGVKATLLGGDRWNDPHLFDAGADALDGSYTTGLFSANDPDPQVRKFASDYAARFGGPPPAQAALAYDATKLLADAVARAGATDGAKLRDAVAQTSGFKGVTGELSFNAERNAVKLTVVFKIQGGKFYPVFRGEI
ncbi:MAG TPA: ABC transporter substrate-binding protein [Pyrinomonadaceae bacterium]|nr:ABC transporter substrate-binding protein [Pyrinomonadaceae bacterium]